MVHFHTYINSQRCSITSSLLLHKLQLLLLWFRCMILLNSLSSLYVKNVVGENVGEELEEIQVLHQTLS